MIENRPKIINLINKLNKNKVDKDVYDTFNESINKKVDDNLSAINEIANNEVRVELVEQTTKSTIDKYIEDGTIANLTIKDNSIETVKYKDKSVTEEKIDENLINELRYIYDEEGNKYTITIDKDGNIVKNRIYEIPTDGLILDIQVNGENVVDAISGNKIEKLTVEGEYFKNSSRFNLISTMGLENIGSDFTIVAVPFIKSSELINQQNNNNYRALFETSSGYNPLNLNIMDARKYFDIYDLSDFSNMVSMKDHYYYYAFVDSEKNKLFDNSDLFYAFSKDYSNNLYTIRFNEYSEKYTPNEKTLTYLSIGTSMKYRRIMIYNRALNNLELDTLYIIIKKTIEQYKYYPVQTLTNGLIGLGSPTAINRFPPNKYSQYFNIDTSKGNHIYESSTGRIYEFENIEFENPVVEYNTEKYEELIFINPIKDIRLGEMYAIEAMPYPYNVKTDSYNIEYESDKPEILECYQGILIPKTIGSAVITAKISNSEIITQITIEVKEKELERTNFCYIPENYVYGIHALNSKNPISVANAIRGAIYDSAKSGYEGVIFPQKEYRVKFSDYYNDGNQNYFIQVPNNFIIDFNNSKLFVEPRNDVKDNGIALFLFGNLPKQNSETKKYNDYILCHNSEIKNLLFYGERYTTSYNNENEFFGSSFAKFNPSSQNCKLYNIHTEGTTGWVIESHCSDYNYWTGTDRRGRTYYTDYVSGKLNETGTEVIEDSTGMWYCTPEYLTLGYTYGKNSVKSDEMDKYVFGFMGIVTYGNSGRWYDIYFFDEEKNLISYNPKQFGLEPYQLPENAVYFKVNVPFGEKPTKNSGEDTCVIRLYPYMEPTNIYIDKCSFVNPQYTCLSMTAGVGFVVRDTYVENGVITGWMWAIDWEDGWQAMRHNIHYNIVCDGNLQQPGGHHCCVLNCIITGEMNITNDTEGTITINSAIKTFRIKAKTNEFIQNIYYVNLNKTYSFPDISTIQDINNIKLNQWNF